MMNVSEVSPPMIQSLPQEEIKTSEGGDKVTPIAEEAIEEVSQTTIKVQALIEAFKDKTVVQLSLDEAIAVNAGKVEKATKRSRIIHIALLVLGVVGFLFGSAFNIAAVAGAVVLPGGLWIPAVTACITSIAVQQFLKRYFKKREEWEQNKQNLVQLQSDEFKKYAKELVSDEKFSVPQLIATFELYKQEQLVKAQLETATEELKEKLETEQKILESLDAKAELLEKAAEKYKKAAA